MRWIALVFVLCALGLLSPASAQDERPNRRSCAQATRPVAQALAERAAQHLAKAGPGEESLTDEELARLMAEADPARIRAAMPRMNPELQRVAQMVLKEIEPEKP